MHHLNELNRKRPLYLYLLTPEDVVPAVTNSFIITKNNYGELTETSNFTPLWPNQKKVQPVQEKIVDESLVNRRKEFIHMSKKKVFYSQGCPICGKDHVAVEYYGHQHVCIKCQRFIKNQEGQSVKIMLDKNDQIVAVAYDDKKQLRYADFEKLMIFGKNCYVSFAGPGELIVLLSEEGPEV